MRFHKDYHGNYMAIYISVFSSVAEGVFFKWEVIPSSSTINHFSVTSTIFCMVVIYFAPQNWKYKTLWFVVGRIIVVYFNYAYYGNNI